MKRTIFVLLTFCFIPVSYLMAQVNITSKEFKVSYFNNTNCDGYLYEGFIPVFNDTSKFFSQLQDSIIDIYKNWFVEDEIIFSPPDFSNLTIETSCLSIEQSTLNYEIFSNTSDLLSFNVTSSWSAGGFGTGMSSVSYCFNIDLKQKKIITLGFVTN